MLEKEVKILEVDVLELQNKLELAWANKTFEWFIHDVYYDFQDTDTNDMKMESQKRLFRVRQKWDIHMYTIKRKRSKKSEWWEKWLRICDEWESEITDVNSFKRVLKKYWMTETREKKKYRICYELEWCQFDIDNYFLWDKKNIIPPLLEIEANTSNEIKHWIKLLDLKNHKKKKWWSRKLFKHYWVEYSWL